MFTLMTILRVNGTFSCPDLLRRSTRFTYVYPYDDAPSLHRIGSVDYRCQKGAKKVIRMTNMSTAGAKKVKKRAKPCILT